MSQCRVAAKGITSISSETVPHYEWSLKDCHACPSREITERYKWEDNRDRFVLVDRTERQIEK